MWPQVCCSSILDSSHLQDQPEFSFTFQTVGEAGLQQTYSPTETLALATFLCQFWG